MKKSYIVLLLLIIFFMSVVFWAIWKYVDISYLTTAEVTTSNWLEFISGYISACGTIFLGIIALYQNKKMEALTEREMNSNQRLMELEEINNMPVITVKHNDIVSIDEAEQCINLGLNLFNEGKSPITVLHALNEVDDYTKQSIVHLGEITDSVRKDMDKFAELSNTQDNVMALSNNMLLEQTKFLKEFFEKLSELHKDEIIQKQVPLYINIVKSVENYIENTQIEVREIKETIKNLANKAAQFEIIYKNICPFKDFGVFTLNDSSYIGVGEQVPRNIKFPLCRNPNDIWVAPITFEFKNIYGTWYREKMEIQVSDNKRITASALSINKIDQPTED